MDDRRFSTEFARLRGEPPFFPTRMVLRQHRGAPADPWQRQLFPLLDEPA